MPNYMTSIKTILTILSLLWILWSSGQESKNDSCRRIIGKSEYLLADYSNIGWTKEMQDTLTPLVTQFRRCFCDNQDKIFLQSLKNKQDAFVTIEPKITNLKSCDGLYSYRVFLKQSKLTPHFINGIWHEVFLVSNNKVYYLNDLYNKDTLSVNKLIDNLTPDLLKLFSDTDIESMRKLGNQSVYWSYNSIEVPLIIYSDKGEIHFDNRRKE
jgi:hypothetical protein